MDLDLSDDQVALRDGIRSMLRARFGPDRVREGFNGAVWDELTAAGVVTLVTDGFGWADAAVVFEQLGEACVPGPLVAGVLAHAAGCDGIVGCVEVPASPRDPVLVEHLDALDRLVVLGPDHVGVLDARSLSGDASPWPLDPLTPVTTVAALPESQPLPGADAHAWRRQGALLTAAFALGLAQRLTEMSVAYAKEREQFDRPIASFQAVKHLCADMLVRTEVARGAVYAAAAHLDAPDDGVDLAVSVAKAMAGEAAIANGKAATQVHGGMGYTWEVDVHLYLKRAWVLDTHFGSRDHHADLVADAFGVAVR